MKKSLAFTIIAACLGAAGAGSAPAQQAVTCVERVHTTAAKLANPADIAGFKEVIGKSNSAADSFLQSVAVYSGAVAPDGLSQPAPKGKNQIDWTLDGQKEVFVACQYEGGVTLSRSVGKAKTCTAIVKRSTEKDASGWGMDSAKVACR